MQDNHHNSLEDVFRDGIDRPATGLPPETEWQEMRNLLLSEDLIRKRKKSRFFIFFLLTFFAGIVAGMLFITNNDINEILPAVSRQESVENKPTPSVTDLSADQKGSGNTGGNTGASSGAALVPEPDTNDRSRVEEKSAGQGSQGFFPAMPDQHPPRKENINPGIKMPGKADQEKLIPETVNIEDKTQNKTTREIKDTVAQLPPDSIKKALKLVSRTFLVQKTSNAGSMQAGKLKLVKEYREYEIKKWGLGLYIAPERSRYRLRDRMYNNGGVSLPRDTAKKLYPTFGLNLSYSRTRNFYILTGLWYSKKPEVSVHKLFAGYGSNGSGSSYNNYVMEYRGHYLEVPLSVKYYSKFLRFMRVYGQAGIIAEFNMPGSKSYFICETFQNGERSVDRINLSPLSIGITGHLAAGVELRVNSKWSFYAEPFYKHGFSPVVKHRTYTNIPVDHMNRSWGAAGGLIYHFNKFKL
jgi:hypothetical protein